MRKKILYICFYDYPGNDENLTSFPAANAKISYIIELLVNLGFDTLILSLCEPKSNNFLFGRTKNLAKNITIKFISLFGSKFRYLALANFYLRKISLFLHLVLFAKKYDAVFIYHSLAYADVVFLARKIINFNLVLQVEEIYQDAVNCSRYIRNFEYKVFSVAEKFIFPTILLDKKINSKKLPSVILHGTYSNYESNSERFNDGLIHVVYAGTFDANKGGVYSAIDSAYFLDSKFHLHILGFGSPSDISTVKQKISDVSKNTKSIITYEGLLTGKEYSNFIRKCNIGLSTQNPKSDFNDTSFPSKILSYMTHGLKVVTVRIPVIETSSISNFVTYTHTNNPKDIANAIISCSSIKSRNPHRIISDLNKSALIDFSNFLK